MHTDSLQIGNQTFTSRLFLGTGKFPSLDLMQEAVKTSESELVTLALKRHQTAEEESILGKLQLPGVNLLPNTSGARNAKEAVLAAQLSAEAMQTKFIKLEIHPDPKYLLPDAEETLKATQILAKEGFTIMPYIHADPVLCKKLEEAGAAVVMPLGAPIGTNKGLRTLDFLEIIIEQSNVPVVIDAGIGAPSHAAQAMEIGADAVLVNTAIAVAGNPIEMADAFRMAVQAGRKAYLSKLGKISQHAEASSPLTNFLS